MSKSADEMSDMEYWDWYFGELARYHEWGRHYKIEFLKANMDLVLFGLELKIVTIEELFIMFGNECFTLNSLNSQFVGDLPTAEYPQEIKHEQKDYSDVIELLQTLQKYGLKKRDEDLTRFQLNKISESMNNINSCLQILGLEPIKESQKEKLILRHSSPR